MVSRRLADAQAHAAAGNHDTAKARVDELGTALYNHISDGRAAFYRAAFAQHARAGLDADIHQIGIGPTPEGEQAARRATVLGVSHADQIVDVTRDADAALDTAILAGGGDWLDGWRSDYAEQFGSIARSALSDSQIAIYEAVGQILVKPELR
jgi:hypothetical protein